MSIISKVWRFTLFFFMNKFDGSVICEGLKKTRQEGIISVQFRQECMRPVANNSAMRKVFMQGHKSFGPCKDIRNCWVTMTTEAYKEFKLCRGAEFPREWEPRIIALEFYEGEEIPVEYRDLYNNAEIFTPQSWGTITQKPKSINDKIITFKGLPVFRDNHLMIGDTIKKDFLKIPD